MLIDKSQNSTYIKLDSVDTPKGVLSAWRCPQSDSPVWDTFLSSTPYGHFYQTSMWAQVRVLDGWQPLIMLIMLNDQLIGGFQILQRSKAYLGKIGLVLKGPVVESDDPLVLAFVVDTLKRTTKQNKIKALIIQPPDKHQDMANMLKSLYFSVNHVDFAIKTNTVVIDLRDNEDEIFKRIKRIKRQNIKTAISKGVTVRQGNKEDLDIFFQFMIETCKRQQVAPSPSNIDFVYKLWDLFSHRDNIKLFMTECENELVSCLLVLPFGDTVYLWKFGWSGKYAKYHPNIVTYWEIFKWAKAKGYLFADLGAISTDLADTILRGETATEEMSKTYSYFKVSLGGEVVPLTNGFVYIPNSVIRFAYNLLMPYINTVPFLRKRILASGG